MAQFERYFTVDEANELLPELRQIFWRIHQIMAGMRVGKSEMQAVLEAARGNGGSKKAAEGFGEWMQVVELVQEIQKHGAFVKDLRMGLVDFPAWREGREVFLCWKVDEPEIGWWHDLETGYAGRQPLT